MAPRVKDKFVDGSCGLIATAPYNFVPLPTDICIPKDWNDVNNDLSKFDDENNKQSKEIEKKLYNKYVQYVHDYGKHCGYIEVDITTRTSTLVGEYYEDSRDERIASFFSIQNSFQDIPSSPSHQLLIPLALQI